MVTNVMCPKCMIGEIQPWPGDDPEDVGMYECRSCGFLGDGSEFRTFRSDEMPMSMSVPIGEAYYGTPLSEGVKFWREVHTDNEGTSVMKFTNIPHFFGDSASFDWGYMGTGPSRFALNVIETVLRNKHFEGHAIERREFPGWNGRCFVMSWQLHMKFKQQVIAKAPSAGSLIPLSLIEDWLVKNGVVFKEDA